ncbi:RNA binding protein fox-1 like 1-like [Dissostichus eleginoides]|uniref:RNA binding protein fox-1 like 1-like n=1 Tax=Dissostichus eleginoides TaxID=100907 RepID=A0AAD9C6A2_DISEL|nr:RNA binding protein fox-1 like 1-like [Dissostichus eleginoides]
MAGFPYPMAAPTLAYRGSALRGGRGRAVYSTIRSAAAAPTAVPGYPGMVYQDGLYGAEVYGGYPAAYRVAHQRLLPRQPTVTDTDVFIRHLRTPITTQSDQQQHMALASLYRGGYNRFTPY